MSELEVNVREGSSLHYSLLWTDPAASARFKQRLLLIEVLATTLDDVHEPQVAQKKIHWWHEELQRLNDGSARHPAVQKNQESLEGLDLAMAACLDIVSAASTQRFTPFETNDASDANLILSFRARLALLAHALSGDAVDLDAEAHPELAALAFARYEQLARLPALIHRGQPVFSNELYQQFKIRPQDLSKHVRIIDTNDSDNADASDSEKPLVSHLKSIPIVTENPGRQALLAHAIELNRALLHKAVDNQTVQQRYRQPAVLPLWRLLVLRRHQLDLWKKTQPDLLRERTTLTPLVKLFRAWQHRR